MQQKVNKSTAIGTGSGQHRTVGGGGGARGELWATNIGMDGAAAMRYGCRLGVTITIPMIPWPGGKGRKLIFIVGGMSSFGGDPP